MLLSANNCAHGVPMHGRISCRDCDLAAEDLDAPGARVLPSKPSVVDHPPHYTFGRFETIDVIEDWELGFCLGNAVKYISRAGRKDPAKTVEDIEKAAWYLARHIERLKGSQ